MFYRLYIPLLAFLAASLAGYSQENLEPPVQVRVILHAPMNPEADLYYMDRSNEFLPVQFRTQNLSRPFNVVPLNGTLVFYDKPNVDPKNLEASVAARAKIPAGIRRAIVVVAPAGSEGKPDYRLLVIDDSKKAFSGGESLVLPLVNTKVVVHAGEHIIPVYPGKLAKVPFVEEKDDFNMAQTNFHYQEGSGSWVTFAERKLQYLEASRRIFIIHKTPRALQPQVTTIIDVNGV